MTHLQTSPAPLAGKVAGEVPPEGVTEPKGFILKVFNVHVRRFDTHTTVVAASRSKARAEAWTLYRESYPSMTIMAFAKEAHITVARSPDRFGHPITVLGKGAFFLGNDSQYVRFAYPGGTFGLNAHPFDVEPQDYRPVSYQREISA